MLSRVGERRFVDRGGNVRTAGVVTQECGATELLSGVTEFGVGAFVERHSHNCEESVVVLEGEGVLEVSDGERIDLYSGDATFIAPRTVHRIINTSDSILRILWIYGRVDATRRLARTGQTYAIGSERAPIAPIIHENG